MSELTPIIPSVIAISDRVLPRYFVGSEPSDDTAYKSFMGLPVYSPLEILEDAAASGIVAGQVQFSKSRKVALRIDTVLMTVTQSKTIIRTPIQGRNGTIKEYISDGDFQIEIEGSIISQYLNVFPEDDFRTFNKILGRGKQIDVACDFLALCGIYTMVIESAKMSQKMGSRNEVPFNISAWSDFAEEIILPDDFLQ